MRGSHLSLSHLFHTNLYFSSHSFSSFKELRLRRSNRQLKQRLKKKKERIKELENQLENFQNYKKFIKKHPCKQYVNKKKEIVKIVYPTL